MEIKYINKPMHPVTVTVVGAGGNGSQMINQLGRINYALQKLGHQGLHVILIDDDKVSESNIGRQLFTEAEIGEYKANVLISRINRFYGTAWESKVKRFAPGVSVEYTNIYITCTDNIQSRYDMHGFTKKLPLNKRHEQMFHYWIDMGNTKTTGQVICGSHKYKLPTIIDRYPKARKMVKKDDTPSCSLAEALERQDLFVNTFISNVAAKLLWEMLTKTTVDWCGAYVNLDTMNFKKIRA